MPGSRHITRSPPAHHWNSKTISGSCDPNESQNMCVQTWFQPNLSVKSPNEPKPGLRMSTYAGEKRRDAFQRRSLAEGSYDSLGGLPGETSYQTTFHGSEVPRKKRVMQKLNRIDKAFLARTLEKLDISTESESRRKWIPPSLGFKPLSYKMSRDFRISVDTAAIHQTSRSI